MVVEPGDPDFSHLAPLCEYTKRATFINLTTCLVHLMRTDLDEIARPTSRRAYQHGSYLQLHKLEHLILAGTV
jgi:hypothetical protein